MLLQKWVPRAGTPQCDAGLSLPSTTAARRAPRVVLPGTSRRASLSSQANVLCSHVFHGENFHSINTQRRGGKKAAERACLSHAARMAGEAAAATATPTSTAPETAQMMKLDYHREQRHPGPKKNHAVRKTYEESKKPQPTPQSNTNNNKNNKLLATK